MEPRTRLILIIEVIVGVLVLIGAVFVFSIEGNTPSETPTESPLPSTSKYISSPLQISLEYPYGWQIDTSYNGIPGIERYEGPDGYFRVDATNDTKTRAKTVLKKYPKPITIGDATFKYLLLEADDEHRASISASIEFITQ